MAKRPAVPKAVLEKLLNAGYQPTLLARILDVDLDNVRSMTPKTRQQYAPSLEELREAIRVVAWQAIAQMQATFTSGTHEQKMRLAQGLLAPMVRQAIAQADAPKELEELRADFESMMEEMREELGDDAAPPPVDDPH